MPNNTIMVCLCEDKIIFTNDLPGSLGGNQRLIDIMRYQFNFNPSIETFKNIVIKYYNDLLDRIDNLFYEIPWSPNDDISIPDKLIFDCLVYFNSLDYDIIIKCKNEHHVGEIVKSHSIFWN